MSSTPLRRPGYARIVGQVVLAAAALTAMAAPVLDPGPRDAVWWNALAIAGYVALERFCARTWAGRPISLLRGLLLIATSQPIFLIASFFIEGDATYRIRSGNFSHAQGAGLVAGAGVALFVAAVAGALLAGRRRVDASTQRTGLVAGYSRAFLGWAAWLAIAHGFLRIIMVFGSREIPLAIGYAVRLYLSLFLAIFVFLGMGLRFRHLSARVATGLSALVSLVVLFTGGRSDALFPLFFLALGYVLAKPMEGRALIRGALVGVPVFLLAMFFGGAVRGDERGRTGEAALARVDSLGEVFAANREATVFSGTTVRRMVSNSTHAVITRIPSELPFEPDGLVKIPSELHGRFLPRLNLSGISESESPRHWILNDLGFLVTWGTSVEFTLVADAWYRAGWKGILVVGLLLGFFLQGLENLVYALMRRVPQFSAVLVFASVGLLQVGARDIVGAIRTIVFLAGAAGLVVLLAARPTRRNRFASPQPGWAAPGLEGRRVAPPSA